MTVDKLLERMIDRKKMPQILAADVQDCLKYLTKNGISNKKETVSAGQIIPMQTLNMQKVEALKASKHNLDKPVLVTNKYELVDGHHRWAANRDLGNKVNVIKLNASFDDVYEALTNYNKVFYKDMNESLKVSLRSQMGNSINLSINGIRYEYIIDGDAADIFRKANKMAKVSPGKALNLVKKYATETIKENKRQFYNSNVAFLLDEIFKKKEDEDEKKKDKKDEKKAKIEYDPELRDLPLE